MDISDQAYFSLTTPLVFIVLAVILLLCWRIQPQGAKALLWLAGSFALGTVAYTAQALIPIQQLSRWAPGLGLLHFSAAFCLARCVAAKFDVRLNHFPALLLFGATASALSYFSYVENSIPMRTLVIGIGLGLLLMIPLPALLRQRELPTLDKYLLRTYLCFVIFLFIRPLLLVGEAGTSNHNLFWSVTVVGVLLFGLLFVCGLLACWGRDTIAVLQTERSQDPLTGLLNRRAFYESALKTSVAEQVTELQTVVMCDLDHFKRINDRYGHAAGDRVLQRFAFLLRDGLRDGDLAARFGGEEFVLLLQGVSHKQANIVVERIRETMSQQYFESKEAGTHFQVTASFGFTQRHSYEPLELALQRADALLYQAKREGRNRASGQLTEAPPLAPAPEDLSGPVRRASDALKAHAPTV